ncbi:MAG: protein BART-1 [Lachnospiraceae bacterium]
MDREFMEQYYDLYEDPIGTAVEGNEAYEQLSDVQHEMEEEFAKCIGGVGSENWKRYEKMMMVYFSKISVVSKCSYLMGAADRERMLR